MPLLVLFGFPVARVVELAAVDLRVAAGAGHVDLQAADHAGAAAGHLPPAAPQRDGDARLGGGVAVVRIDLLPRLQRARALGLVEGAPVTLAQAEETGIATLGGEVHPCIGARAVELGRASWRERVCQYV